MTTEKYQTWDYHQCHLATDLKRMNDYTEVTSTTHWWKCRAEVYTFIPWIFYRTQFLNKISLGILAYTSKGRTPIPCWTGSNYIGVGSLVYALWCVSQWNWNQFWNLALLIHVTLCIPVYTLESAKHGLLIFTEFVGWFISVLQYTNINILTQKKKYIIVACQAYPALVKIAPVLIPFLFRWFIVHLYEE